MKTSQIILISTALCGYAAAQTPVSPPVIIEERIIETDREVAPPIRPAGAEVQAAQRRLDAALARERLGIAPTVISREDDRVVETTVETTRVETPGMPPRIYSTERNVVIVEGRELPYLTIPVLFVEGSAELLDAESRLAIEDTANAIKHVLIENPTAVFDVEGHTSTDGTDEMNMRLSADRASRIHRELIEHYQVPTSSLAAHGYGENYPTYPDGTEEQMVQDRRVLVVRVK